MSTRLSQEFIAELGDFMEKETTMSANLFLQIGMSILNKYKLVKHAKNVLPKYFLVHKENRNRLMLNPLNVHHTCYVISGLGAYMKQLSGVICVEHAQWPHTNCKYGGQ